MISAFPSLTISARRFFTTTVSRSVFIFAAAFALCSSLSAQNTAAPADDTQGRGRRGNRGQGGQGGGGNFDPAQFQQQAMDRMREQFGVTDDAEWKLITDKITAITELRGAVGGRGGGFAAFAGRGGGGGGQGGQGGGRQGRNGFGASPEQDSLRQAITDKLPDAEIKARLARLREVRKANEEKLTKAQEDLRALLDVRQEAVAVMAQLLP